MKKKLIIATIVATFLALASYLTSNAKRTYALNGNSIVCIDSNVSQGFKTDFTYKVKDVEYPIYTSPKGRCYILKTSKKTGKEYKQYLPKEADSLIQVQLKRKTIKL